MKLQKFNRIYTLHTRTRIFNMHKRNVRGIDFNIIDRMQEAPFYGGDAKRAYVVN